MLEELRCISPTVRSKLFEIRLIAAAIGHFRCAFKKHAQSQQLMNTETSKKGLPACLLSDTSDAPSTESNLPMQRGLESYQHFAVTMKVVLKLKELILLDCTPIADYPHKSQQQRDLSRPRLPQA